MNKELIQKRFQSARRWTTVLLVFLILGTLSSLVSLPGTLKPDRQTYESIDNLQVYNFINHPLYKVYAILLIALNFFLIVKFFQNRKLLIGQKLCPEISLLFEYCKDRFDECGQLFIRFNELILRLSRPRCTDAASRFHDDDGDESFWSCSDAALCGDECLSDRPLVPIGRK